LDERRGSGHFRRDLPRVLADETNDLTPAMRRMLAELGEDVARLDARIAQVGREIEGLADRDDRARRLMTIPGIGPLAATALLAAIGDGRQFRRARDLAA
jgi:transposase